VTSRSRASANTRAVSIPMPELAPVTTARRPVRSIPAITSSAVEYRPNSLVINGFDDFAVPLDRGVERVG
jgi:hypothetical protein